MFIFTTMTSGQYRLNQLLISSMACCNCKKPLAYLYPNNNLCFQEYTFLSAYAEIKRNWL